MIPKIKSVEKKGEFILVVLFDNNVVKEYDIEKLIKKNSTFEILRDKAIFSMVQVDAGGYGISWSEDLDLSEYELWINGKQIN